MLTRFILVSFFRQTDIQTDTAQVQVLSCALAAKKSPKKCVLNDSEWPETDFEQVFKKLTVVGGAPPWWP